MKAPKFLPAAVLVSLCAFSSAGCGENAPAEKDVSAAESSLRVPASEPVWLTDWAAAKERARETRTDILFNFTGTSWCPACIVLEKQVLDTEDFKKITPQFTLMRVLVERGENPESTLALTREFRVNAFPTVFLMDSSARPYAILSGANRTPAEYIARIDTALKIKAARDAAFTAAEKETGTRRAELLSAGLGKLDAKLLPYYAETIKDIVANDPEDKFGFAAKEERERKLAEQNEMLRNLMQEHSPKNGERISSELVRANILAVQDFLKNEEILPPVRQSALKFIGESYSMLAEIPLLKRVEKIREYYIAARDADPDSPAAKKIESWIEHYSKILERENASE